MKNEHIAAYLDSYIDIADSPNYAVMISGKWGAGKTFFIKKYLESKKVDYIYVSLYGVSNISQIEDLIFENLHPILSNKKVKLIKNVLSGISKGILKIDWDNDGSEDVVIQGGIPQISLKNLSNRKNALFIFDDLERVSGNLKLILGFINKIVEHEGFKSIILANEEEIDKNDNNYKRIKEKLVGCTLEVVPEIDDVLEDFISVHFNNHTKVFYSIHKETIKNAFLKSRSNNLRLLLIALRDFERIFLLLKKEILNKNELISEVLYLFLFFSFEINSGELTFLEIEGLTNDGNFLFYDQNSEEKVVRLLKKYSIGTWTNLIINISSWSKIFVQGYIRTKDLEDEILQKHFNKNENPLWYQLWNYRNLDTQKFNELINEANGYLSSGKFSDLRELIHFAGIYLKLSILKVLNETGDEILIYFKKILDNKLRVNPEFLQDWIDKEYLINDDGQIGAIVIEYGNKYHSEFRKYIELKIQETNLKNAEEFANDIPSLLSNNIEQIKAELCYSKGIKPRFYSTPVFDKVLLEKFFQAFICLSPEEQWEVVTIFRRRIIGDYATQIENIAKERVFLQSFSEKLKSVRKSKEGTIDGVRIDEFLDIVMNCIKRISDQNA